MAGPFHPMLGLNADLSSSRLTHSRDLRFLCFFPESISDTRRSANYAIVPTSPLVLERSAREPAASLFSVGAVDGGELLPVPHVILCSSGSLDRSNRVNHCSLDSDSVETPFTAPAQKFAVAHETVARSGAAEGCVKDKRML
jgi:hypothetical protein